jgi:adenylate cyclase
MPCIVALERDRDGGAGLPYHPETMGRGPAESLRGDADARGFLERELGRRALDTERKRLLILAGFAVVPFLAFAGAKTFAPDLVTTVFHGRVTWGVALAACAVLAGYALASRAWLTRLQATGRTPPLALRYVQAFAEASLPTVILGCLFVVFDPVLALFTPPLLLYPLIIVLSAFRLEPALSVFTGAVAALEYGGLSYYAVTRTHLGVDEPMLFIPPHHIGKAVLLLACGVVTGLTAKRIRDGIVASVEMLEDRNRVLDVFGKHVSPEVVNKLLAQRTELVAEVRTVCMMFLDIRGFTKYSEARRPEEIVAYLNALFSFMIEHVIENGGIINKFLGDGFMAIFGAPVGTEQDCANAVAASRAILATVEREVSAGRLPPTRIGIALHSGPAITGHVGSARRREYTVIGDVVNVAARIETLNKEFGSQLLISGAVLQALVEPPEGMTALGPVAVRGRGDPIDIYRVA